MKDKELIKQEIESYKESMKGLEPHSDFRRGQLTAYNQIMQFIDSLPEEPVSEDLEEEIERCWKEMFPIGWSDYTLLTLTYEQHKAFARHFAEWQKQEDKQDFLKKAEKFFNDMYDTMGKPALGKKTIEQFKNYMQNESEN